MVAAAACALRMKAKDAALALAACCSGGSKEEELATGSASYSAYVAGDTSRLSGRSSAGSSSGFGELSSELSKGGSGEAGLWLDVDWSLDRATASALSCTFAPPSSIDVEPLPR